MDKEDIDIHLRKEPCAECGTSTWHHDLVDHAPQCHKCYVKEFLKQPKPSWCICDNSFWQNGKYDPRCRHEDVEELHKKIRQLQNGMSE